MSKTGEICLKHQIPYYHPLTDWLLGTTISNRGSSMFMTSPPPTMSKTPQTSSSLLSPTN